MADILNNLNSANYITVKVTDDPITNGNNLLEAYRRAKTTTPNNSALSSSNRLGIILPPAIYDLGTQSLTLDTQFIDLIGSTDDRDKHYIKSNVGVINRGTIIQTANNVKLYNLTIENTNTTSGLLGSDGDPSAYFPTTNLNNTYIENIRFLTNNSNALSMRRSITYSGTFINCTGGDFSFGGGGVASGTFTNCSGGSFSFGGFTGTASGTFTNCTGENASFGGGFYGSGGVLSGTFINCTGGDFSFGGSFFSSGGTLSGVFRDCTAGGDSFGSSTFGAAGTLMGTFTNCRGRNKSFGIT